MRLLRGAQRVQTLDGQHSYTTAAEHATAHAWRRWSKLQTGCTCLCGGCGSRTPVVWLSTSRKAVARWQAGSRSAGSRSAVEYCNSVEAQPAPRSESAAPSSRGERIECIAVGDAFLRVNVIRSRHRTRHFLIQYFISLTSQGLLTFRLLLFITLLLIYILSGHPTGHLSCGLE